MTEEEAKDKLCPYKMGIQGGSMKERGCDGAICMLWKITKHNDGFNGRAEGRCGMSQQ